MTEDGRKIASSLLDPADWDAFRSDAHALLDRLISRLEQAGEGPVWTPTPETVKRRLAEPPPLDPRGVHDVCNDLAALILPYGTGNTHPRFWGWVHGSGTAGGVLAEMAAAAMNANCGGRDHGAIHVERCVLDWMAQWFGFPKNTAGGLLVTGSSMANLLGLAAARNRAVKNVRRGGLNNARLTGYTSREAHSCIGKAFELLGLGRDALRHIRTGDDFAIDIDWLRAEVKHDRAEGFQPFCVVATAGTVNTGASDDIAALAEFCRSENLWLHVDGAFGALTVLCPDLAPRLAGIEQAHSLAFDFHKWLHVPYDAGCLLVRDETTLLDTFADRAPYLAGDAALAGGDIWPCDLGLELSRGFRALKVWFTLQEHGTRRLGEAIARNCEQADALAAQLARRPAIRVMAPVPLQIVCCRYQVKGLDETATDALNAELVATLQRRGIAAPSTCRIHGRLCIRVNITNHRTSDTDLTMLVDAIDAIGAELAAAAQMQRRRAS
ncbi:MAG TPA: pyridoxal-dependent decarboxylase [Xanthobacteraceae bacterium]|nr:pyridoxal-dependent decarboxylase [Xanthobacteraceae bacterium]